MRLFKAISLGALSQLLAISFIPAGLPFPVIVTAYVGLGQEHR
jgi:hypothetical protein